MTPRPAIVAALLLLLSASGCQSDDGAAGDCNALFGLDGTVYRSHNLLAQEPLPHERRSLGQAEMLDCDGRTVDEAAAYRIRGVDPRVAIVVDGSDWGGTYVATDVPRSDWPDLLTR